jgi:hypothetical protein
MRAPFVGAFAALSSRRRAPAVTGALDDPPMMRGDGGIDEIAAQPPKTHERPILVRSHEPGGTDDLGDQDRRDFPGLAHGAPLGRRPI